MGKNIVSTGIYEGRKNPLAEQPRKYCWKFLAVGEQRGGQQREELRVQLLQVCSGLCLVLKLG